MTGDRKITRNRVSYSCQVCRQRKVKCDKVHPVCGSCQKAGKQCVYVLDEIDQQLDDDLQNAETENSKKRKQAPTRSHGEPLDDDKATQRDSDLEEQLLRLNALLNRLSDVAGVDLGKHAGEIHPEQLDGLHRESLIHGPRQTDSGSLSSHNDDSRHQPRDRLTHLRRETETTASPSIDSISAQLEQLTALLRSQQKNVNKLNDLKHDTARRPYSSLQPHDTNSRLIDSKLSIPTEGQRNALFRCWLSSVYPILPIVDPMSTLLNYRTLHYWYAHGLEKGVENPVEESVPLTYAIYYAGAMSMSLRGVQKWFPGLQRHRILDMFRKQFVLCLKAPAKSLLNPLTLAARTMMCYLSPRQDTGIGLTSVTISLIKTAYSLNLHRERPNGTQERTIIELRRRLWWEIVNLDIQEATTCNVPPFVNHHYCDVLTFGELKDFKYDTPEAKQYEFTLADGRLPDAADDPITNNRSSMISVVYLAMSARTLLASSARQLLSINLAVRPKTRADMIETRRILTEASRNVNSVIDRIPTKGLPELAFTPTGGRSGQSLALDHGAAFGEDLLTSEVEAMCGAVVRTQPQTMPFTVHYRVSMTAFHKWIRIALSMLIDQLHCLSFAPFLSNARSRLWIAARQCALRHAHGCLRKFNSLATDLELERFRWSWPCMFQPVHACVIILLDTYERPMSREASRSRALFDQMLSVSSPEYGVVGGTNGLTSTGPIQGTSSESYIMLMQLRARAWHKAGLDPTVLWTEQDQIDVGIAKPPTSSDRAARSMREDVILDANTPSEGQEDSRSGRLFKAMIEQRGKEVSHPAELGVPEENSSSPPPMMTYSGCDGNPPTMATANGQRFLRARRDQQRTPHIHTPHLDSSEREDHRREGHIYDFVPPSELFDIDQLIQKIKSVQKEAVSQPAAGGSQPVGGNSFGSNAAAATKSQTLYEDVVSVNSELETLLSNRPASLVTDSNTGIRRQDTDTLKDGFGSNDNGNGKGNAQGSTSTSRRTAHIDTPTPTQAFNRHGPRSGDDTQHETFRLDTTQPQSFVLNTETNPTNDTAWDPRSSNLPYNPQPRSHPSQLHPPAPPPASASALNPLLPDDNRNPGSNSNIPPTSTATTSNLLATDFDWAKWDEIFGYSVNGEDEYAVDGSGVNSDFDFDVDFDTGFGVEMDMDVDADPGADRDLES